jgi:thioesterase domain-containing protein
MTAADDLARYVAANLPLASAMRVAIEEAGDASVRLRVPLGPNLNHERTAFGGSLAAAGMLAGWGLLWLRARHLTPQPRLVIAESQMRFIRPIAEDFHAVCEWPRPDSWDQARAALNRTGRARVELRTELTTGTRTAAVHDGSFSLIGNR